MVGHKLVLSVIIGAFWPLVTLLNVLLKWKHIHARHKLDHDFGRCDAKAKLCCQKRLVPVTRAWILVFI